MSALFIASHEKLVAFIFMKATISGIYLNTVSRPT